jgi:hypothetical protein
MEITISLPDNVFANVANLASKTHRRVDEVIAEKVEREFSSETGELERPLADCSDAEVLAVANMKMSKAQAKRQSELLYKNQADTITPLERNELESLLLVYQHGNLRKSQGIAEAVLRGLIKTPDDLK